MIRINMFICALLMFLISNKSAFGQDTLGLNWEIHVKETKKTKDDCKGKSYKRQYISLSFTISTIKRVKFKLYWEDFYTDDYKPIQDSIVHKQVDVIKKLLESENFSSIALVENAKGKFRVLTKPSPLAFCDEFTYWTYPTYGYGVDEIEIDSMKIHKGQIFDIPKENLQVEKKDKLVRLHYIFRKIKGIHNSTYSSVLLSSNWFKIP